MQEILELIKSDNFLLGMVIFIIILFLITLYTCIKYSKLEKNYKKFIKKLGEGDTIQEDLETFMYRVDKVDKQNAEIRGYCENLNKELETCIQKIGIIRYNAFKDTGSDLSFALAMLDEKNNGVVLNGIYSREMSNIYAKPVENGKSKYTISEEEQEAIQKAIENKQVYKVREQ